METVIYVSYPRAICGVDVVSKRRRCFILDLVCLHRSETVFSEFLDYLPRKCATCSINCNCWLVLDGSTEKCSETKVNEVMEHFTTLCNTIQTYTTSAHKSNNKFTPLPPQLTQHQVESNQLATHTGGFPALFSVVRVCLHRSRLLVH